MYMYYLHIFQAGLSALDEPIEYSWLLDDPDRYGNALAKQEPLWEPGTI